MRYTESRRVPSTWPFDVSVLEAPKRKEVASVDRIEGIGSFCQTTHVA